MKTNRLTSLNLGHHKTAAFFCSSYALGARLFAWPSGSLRSVLVGVRHYLVIALASVIAACSASQYSQVQSPSEAARSATSFIDSVGVVVHLDNQGSAYEDYDTLIRPRLQELGVRHIRDGVALKDKETQRKFADLATLGIKSTLVMDPREGLKASQAVEIAKAIPTAVEAIEGPNEWDVWPDIAYKEQHFPEGVKRFQSDLYRAIKGNPATAALDVLSPTVAFWQNARRLGSVDCDVSAMHSYAGGSPPSSYLDDWIPATEQLCPGKPIRATEAGWHNSLAKGTPQPGISEAAGGKYVPRLYLEYFNRGVQRVYIHELINRWGSHKDMESNFGLLRRDGTPKPSFVALKNLISLLQDKGIQDKGTQDESSFSPASLDYSMKGLTHAVHHTLLQKRSGSFYLIIWQEVDSFNLSKQRDAIVSPVPVTMKLSTPIRQAVLYSLLPSAQPTAQYTNPTSLLLEVSDSPLVVELLPP